jgi:hypothetical protein
MALSAAVTKKDITNTQTGLYHITLELNLTDSDGTGFINTYSQEYRTGENISAKKQLFISEMQTDIDRYKAAKTLSGAAGLATAITDIQNSLVL